MIMNWKEFFKHSLILFGITILSGLIYFVLTKIVRQLEYVTYLWIPAIIVIILIPLIYSFLSKKSIKELAIITLMFILISSIVSIPIMGIMKNSIRESKGNAPIAILTLTIFSMNPITSIDSLICAPYSAKAINVGSNDQVKVCPLQKFGFFIELIIVGIMAFIIIFPSMIIGNYLSKVRK